MTESTMALSFVSLTLKQKNLCQFTKCIFTITTKRHLFESVERMLSNLKEINIFDLLVSVIGIKKLKVPTLLVNNPVY
jgi:hypothetical protein